SWQWHRSESSRADAPIIWSEKIAHLPLTQKVGRQRIPCSIRGSGASSIFPPSRESPVHGRSPSGQGQLPAFGPFSAQLASDGDNLWPCYAERLSSFTPSLAFTLALRAAASFATALASLKLRFA